MTRDDVIRLDAGDSVIGLSDQWAGEYAVVDAGDLHYTPDGRVFRSIHVQTETAVVRGIVRENDGTIRGALRRVA